MAFQIAQRVAGTQLKTVPYFQLSIRAASSKVMQSELFSTSFI